jgi:hypothetical protein
MDIQAVAEMYGGLPERVVARAREVLRLARAKSSIHEDMKTPVACLVVACRALDEPIDVKKMAALLHFSPRALDQIARKIANLVNAKSTQKVTPASLCVRHGCAAITEFVNRVYDAYQVRFDTKTPVCRCTHSQYCVPRSLGRGTATRAGQTPWRWWRCAAL